MTPKRPADAPVLRWIVANLRIILFCAGLLVAAGIAWATLDARIDENCAETRRARAAWATEMTEVKAVWTTELAEVKGVLATQDEKLDSIGTSVTRLLVIREREDRQR